MVVTSRTTLCPHGRGIVVVGPCAGTRTRMRWGWYFEGQ